MHGHKGKVLYWLPVDIDITSTECLYKRAIENQANLRKLLDDSVFTKHRYVAPAMQDTKRFALPKSPGAIICKGKSSAMKAEIFEV